MKRHFIVFVMIVSVLNPTHVVLGKSESRNIKLLGVLVTSSSPYKESISPEDLSKVLFEGPQSAKQYFEKNSYKTLKISGNVLSTPLPLEHPELLESGGGVRITQLFESLADYVDLNEYGYYFFIVMHGKICSGLASQGLETHDTPDGKIQLGYGVGSTQCVKDFYDKSKVPEIIHELGHAFNLRHSAAWLPHCQNIPLHNMTDEECFSRYGGGNPMGTGQGDLYVYQRNALAGQERSRSRNVTRNGKYWISWWRNRSRKSYEELKIPAVNGYYSIEFRKNIADQIPKGIIINFIAGNQQFYSGATLFIPDTLLVKPPAFSLTLSNPIFTDSLRNISVQLLKIQKNKALIEISLPDR